MPLTYSNVGDNYDTKDPVKKRVQEGARATGANLQAHGFREVAGIRGESAFVWEQGDVYMASVVEGLGTKNLVADATRNVTGKSHYDAIGHDTVATILNDLVSVGARPLVVHAYWAIEDNSWLQDAERMNDLIAGWKSACDLARATWGGGETPTMKGITVPGTIDLGGSAIGIIDPKEQLLQDSKLRAGDRILLLHSTGINTNGLSLARAIADQLPDGYATKLSSGITYGEALLAKTNIYAVLVQELFKAGVELHYISNITGHGLRKIMRAKQDFTYVVERIVEPPELFGFMQKHAALSDREMYQTFNMGMDYALFLPERDVKKAQEVVRQNGFNSTDAGHIENGERKVIIQPKDLLFQGDTLNLR